MTKCVILLEDIVVVEDSNKRYEDTITNFTLDYNGSPIPTVPAGKDQWVYHQGHSNVQWTGNDAEFLSLPWEDGDSVLASIDDILSAKTAREAVEALGSPLPTLNDHKASARKEIDRAAETARARYITLGSGQAMSYQEKGEEAADYVAAGYPVIASPVDYPFVYADSIAFGITPQEAADAILAQKAAWVAIGAQIEQERLGGKNAVTTAGDEAAVDAAVAAAVAALEVI